MYPIFSYIRILYLFFLPFCFCGSALFVKRQNKYSVIHCGHLNVEQITDKDITDTRKYTHTYMHKWDEHIKQLFGPIKNEFYDFCFGLETLFMVELFKRRHSKNNWIRHAPIILV